MSKIRIRRDDQVKVIAGKDKGKVGRVLRVDRDKERVLVEGINLVKKAMRKKSQQDRGGIVEIEAPLHVSNVMVVTRGGKPTRIGIREENGKRVRYAKATGDPV